MKAVIADDEKMARYVLRRLGDWEGLGITLAGEASDGDELWKLIQSEKPDIVITDIRMPGHDGLEIIARCLESGLKPYFLITSAYTDFEYARKAMKLGVEDFLPKPVDRKELNSALAQITGKIRKDGNNSQMTSSLIRQVRSYIEEHYDQKLSLDMLASQFYISPNYLSALFKKELGINFLDYLTEVRMRESIKLLAFPENTVSDVARKTGYRNVSHFSENFVKTYGMTPSVWKKRNL